MYRTNSLSLVTTMILFGLSVAGATDVKALTQDEIANYTKPDRQAVLEAGAKKEGAVLMIGGINAKSAGRPLINAFAKKYPFINAKFVRTSSSIALQRVLAETRANTIKTDVVTGNVVVEMKNANAVQSFKSPGLKIYDDAYKDPEGIYATIRYSYHGIASWNSNNVSMADAPKSYQDLLNPKWKGKIVASDSPTAGLPFLTTYFRKTMGEKEAVDYLAKLAKQEIKISGAATRGLNDMVVAGEYSLLINPATQHVGQLKAKGAPNELSMADPVLTRNGYVVLVKNAPNPHASMLLIDFLLDKEAQTILQKAKYMPAHPDIDPHKTMKAYTPKAKGYKAFILDDAMLTSNENHSMELVQKYFQ